MLHPSMLHPSLQYYSVYLFQFLLFIQFMYGSDSLLVASLTPFVIFFIIPIFESMYDGKNINYTGQHSNQNLTENYNQTLPQTYTDPSNDFLYQIPLLLWAPVQIFLLILFSQYMYTFSPLCLIIFSISVGIINGTIGINVAHELLHKSNMIQTSLAKILLCSVCYGHFYIEHIWGHHKKVATIHDPATASYSESIYHFLPKSIVGGYKDAHKICEANNFPANVMLFGSRYNGVLMFNIFTGLYLIVMTWYFGLSALFFLLLQSFFAIIMLESANYIEHYGLLRDIETNVNIMHSWNTENFVTRILAFGLPNHSDHHYNSKKEYHKLINYPNTPKLPFGYVTCIILSYFPSVWFEIMNPKITNYNKRYQ